MIRRVGYALLAVGLLVLAWTAVTLAWGDPVTSLYTRHEQHALANRLDAVNEQWSPHRHDASRARAGRAHARRPQTPPKPNLARLRSLAVSYRSTLREGGPVGRIVIPRIGLRMVVVQGTSESDLQKGPGHYDGGSGRNTGLPGMGGVIAVAGHRTTYSHPFRHIDDLRPHDRFELQMPYGRFGYTVYHHKIVDDQDWSILRRRPYEKLVLTACHPLHSATHRYVVFARLTSARPA
jgi:sortase A